MAEKARCEECSRNFKDTHGLEAHNLIKHAKKKLDSSTKKVDMKKIKSKIKIYLVIAVVIFGFYLLFSSVANAQSLPPTDMSGHIEVSPESHILKEPMDIRVQKHMLEHVDGGSGVRGGIILNYDCINFECEDELIENLESFANSRDYVYVAPFKNMKNKIVMTRLGYIETLDYYDEEKVRLFVGI